MPRRNCLAMSRIHQAYLAVSLAPQGEDGTRSVCLARHGAFEVRLIDPPSASEGRTCWLELYRHDTGTSLDSCSCSDLDDLESASEYFISCAMELDGALARDRQSAMGPARRTH
jgi:hypothetical protein